MLLWTTDQFRCHSHQCCSLKQSSLCPQEKLSPCSRPCPFRKPGALAAMATHMSTGRSYHLTGRRSKLSEIP
ncbi:hypothetical protein PC116_g20394 [Phytophthora cactorum]|nr:hypothetical protein PC116_g20394 [Phytophthora cactorum]